MDVKAEFVAPNVGIDGKCLVFKLSVTDNNGVKDTDSVRFFIKNKGSMPWLKLLLLDP